jgi:hypothetical protein
MIASNDLLDRTRIALDDLSATEYSDTEIISMLTEAIHTYSNVLPLPLQSALTDWTQTGTAETDGANYYAHTLPTGFRKMTAVFLSPLGDGRHLYDTSNSPVPAENHYLREDYRKQKFHTGRYYDIIERDIPTRPKIVIGTPIPASQYLHIHYLATVEQFDETEDLPIPTEHTPIITAYVVAAFARRKEFSQATVGSGDGVYQAGQAARDAMTHYNRLLANAIMAGTRYLPQSTTAVFGHTPESSLTRWS